MTTVATIQARMGSDRLPGKVLLPLGERYILDQVVERVAQAARIDAVVVATSTERADDLIAQLVPSFGAQVHRGSEVDVLARLSAAARAADATRMVRITADCPFIDPVVIDAVVERAVSTDADYTSNTLERTFPRGSSVEVCTMDSLHRPRRGHGAAPPRARHPVLPGAS
jgi:Spore coat polysaccharide biosynthesis protein F, CMP-KDO synthetase homolog